MACWAPLQSEGDHIHVGPTCLAGISLPFSLVADRVFGGIEVLADLMQGFVSVIEQVHSHPQSS